MDPWGNSMTELDIWHAQVTEEALEPDRPIIDAHHHLWRVGTPYEIDDLWADTGSGHNIVGTVFIECGSEYRVDGPISLQPVGETEYVRGQVEYSQRHKIQGQPPVLGIVCHANLMLGADVKHVLEAHTAAAGELLRGIRHATAFYPDPPAVDRYTGRIAELMMQPKFREGFAQLAPAGLSYDAWLLHTQIKELTALANEFPETTIIFDHFGGPLGIGPYAGKQKELFPQWKADVTELARCKNIVAKLGGLAMVINGWGWDERDKPASSDEIVAAHGDYYRHTIDCFGPDRCMFESNFPVDKLSVSYGVLWNAFKKMTKEFSEPEKDAMFSGTATRIYRL
jgi:predicted TIM-barrel fold metal-dependent hydrolase